MKPRQVSIARLAAGLGTGLTAAFVATEVFAADLMGQPTDGAIDFQPAASALRQRAIDFHSFVLLPILFGISLLVLGLLLWCVFRFNAKANPVPKRFTHNTTVEVLWTLGPVLILLMMAIPSFQLLFAYHDMPKPYMTVKATGYQWYWGYAYPDQKIDEQTSTVLPEAQAEARHVPYMLATTQPMVVPVGKVVQVLVVGADVIHSFSVPAFGIKVDAVPGRVNETWFIANQTGTFYGQCSQLCGTDHSFMPIEVKVLSQADFDAWVAKTAPPPEPAATNAPAAANATTPAAPAAAVAAATPASAHAAAPAAAHG
ncbi:MAG TPA: cytochrome c oxidase subunit II [Caulobacteraceae bacterium]|jgi:cytochrome c oxidase subunit 2|nr:cytochrome c oxidase subunit II [Caulobacteraceae bacterium]